jgi:hypothetical protein
MPKIRQKLLLSRIGLVASASRPLQRFKLKSRPRDLRKCLHGPGWGRRRGWHASSHVQLCPLTFVPGFKAACVARLNQSIHHDVMIAMIFNAVRRVTERVLSCSTNAYQECHPATAYRAFLIAPPSCQ